MDILDWRPGTIGIPTFHCQRCMNHWLIKGDLPKHCDELEEIAEGPAMCLTLSSQASSEMIIDGIIGEDGKTVRIKVTDPVTLRRQLLIRKAKKRRKQKQREARRKRRGYQNKGDVQEDEAREDDEYMSDDSTNSSDSSGEELLGLPKAFQKYILKKAGQHHKRRRDNGRLSTTVSDGELSDGELSYGTSSFSFSSWESSDLSQVSSREYHDQKEQKSPRKQRKHQSKRGCREKATRNSDDSDKNGACSSESDLDSTCSSPHHRRKRKTKSNQLRQHKVKGSSKKCAVLSETEDQDIKTGEQRHAKIQHSNKSDPDMTYSSPNHHRKRKTLNPSRRHKVKEHAELLETEDQGIKTGKQRHARIQHSNTSDLDMTYSGPNHHRKRKSKLNPSRRHKVKESSKKHAELLEAENQSATMGKQQRRNVSDDAHVLEIYASTGRIRHRNVSDSAHLPEIDASTGRIQHRNASNDAHLSEIDAGTERIRHRNVSDDAHLPDTDASARNSVYHRSGQWENGTSNAIDSHGVSNSPNMNDFQLPNIADTSSHSTATRKQWISDPIHLPNLNPHGSLSQHGNDSQGYRRRQSILSHGGTREGSTSLAVLNKEPENSFSSTESTTQLLNPQKQRRSSQMNPNYSGASPRKPTQTDRKHSSGLSAKTATVKENVHIPAGTLPKQLKQTRKKRKSQLVPEESSQIHSSAMDGEPDIMAPLSTTLTDRDRVNPTHNTDYNHPKRFGQKIIKKTKRSKEPQSWSSVSHNSKDLGNLIDDARFKLPKDSDKNQDGRCDLRTIPSSDERSNGDFKLLTSSAKTPTTRKLSGTARRMQQSDFVPLNGTGSSPNSANLDGDLCSGLGAKFVSSDTANYEPPSAPVQLNSIEAPTNKLEFTVGKTKVLPPIKESVENLPVPLSASRTADQRIETDSGLETKEESLGREVSPGYDYNPISALSFTTAYAYSFYPMAAQHRELNNTTRRKVLKPVKLSRTRNKN